MRKHEVQKPTTASNNNQTARLFKELEFALKQMTASDITHFGMYMLKLPPNLIWRRGKNVILFIKRVAAASLDETSRFTKAALRSEGKKYIADRASTLTDNAKDAYLQISGLVALIKNDPLKYAPAMLALALGLKIGSGGLDGNGGIPDTDIVMFGIGDHRSILTHSIIAGVVAEVAILAVSAIADIVLQKLPDNHSLFWDTIQAQKDSVIEMLAVGVSVGIAYHLAVDGTVQVAPYKDLPISMPMEAHQVLFGANAITEMVDAVERDNSLKIPTVADKYKRLWKTATNFGARALPFRPKS